MRAELQEILLSQPLEQQKSEQQKSEKSEQQKSGLRNFISFSYLKLCYMISYSRIVVLVVLVV